jgi:hypothetical protein
VVPYNRKAPAGTTRNNRRRSGMKTPMVYYAALFIFSFAALSIGMAAGIH